MHPKNPATARKLCVLAATLGLAVSAWSQTQTSASPSAPSSTQDAPKAPDSTVTLTPFDVTATADNSYGAINSNSLTRFNIELNKMPVSGDIFTSTFMNDVGATSVEAMIQAYSPGAGSSAISASAGASAQAGDHVAHAYIQLRGFDTPIMIRDSLMPVGPVFNPGSTGPGQTSNFDIERVEVIDGPQSLLYSGGGPGGVINVTSKQARFDQTDGSFLYRVDQYGGKMGQLDFNWGDDNFAIRLASLDQDIASRRLFIGQQTYGYYGQIAIKLFKKTTIRINLEQTTENSVDGGAYSLVTSSATADIRDNQNLTYLLATNALGANTVNAAGNPNASGAILGGNINWGNVNSLAGWLASDYTVNTFENLTVDTTVNSWLSSELAFGYNSSKYDFQSATNTNFYAPQATANPTGQWAIGNTPGDDWEPARTKGIRWTLLATNDLFGGKAHSQTIIGADYVRSDAASIQENYFEADSNWNVIQNPAVTTFAGRTELGAQYYALANDQLSEYPLFTPEAARITINGVNYVRQPANLPESSLITAANPLGLTNTSLYEITKNINKGFFGANFTDWMDGKLTTLIGVRQAEVFDNYLIYAPQSYRLAKDNSTNFEVGANYGLTDWLRPYVTASDIVTPPQVLFPDPAGNLPVAGHGTSEEVGVKFNNQARTISGSFSIYHSDGNNEEYEISSTLENDINPNGLNGRGSVGQYVDVNRTSVGAQFILTANPTPNWRLRLAASDTKGTILDNKSYQQYYNDQFYENSSGDVTYADGTLVYVNPTYSSKTPVVTSTTPGAIPLTVTMMNTPSSPYYANPTNPTGAISSTAAVATVLKQVSTVHGAILTGATGLPISDTQITPSFNVPGQIIIAEKGDQTLGYPQYNANLTSLYTFSTSWIKGFSIGGTASQSWRTGEYYYFPQGVTSGIGTAPRQLFSEPNLTRFDLITSYSRKFRRVTWTTQLNVDNIFNNYRVVIYPDQVTGWTVASNLSAGFWGSPRAYTWTNTLSF